jgi:two-component system cell cycle sensor histidine kinase/response regulator CckA
VGGAGIIDELRALDPSLHAVASSGYSDDPIMAEPERFGFKGSLAKPYVTGDLLRVVDAACRVGADGTAGGAGRP